jgi:organic radical activating enzyme
MFGNNPTRKADYDGDTLWVQSVFYTLQGEALYVGQPAVFVRLAGCNLKCFWCDTDFESSDWHPTIDELYDAIVNVHPTCRLVVLTGGEPMRQNIAPLCEQLINAGYTVQIETAGTLVPPGFIQLKHLRPEQLIIVCSPKTPKVKEHLAPYVDAWKYIIRTGEVSDEDGLPVRSTQIPGRTAKLQRPVRANVPVYVQPCDDQDEELNERNLQLACNIALRHGYRLGFQLHKLAGVE